MRRPHRILALALGTAVGVTLAAARPFAPALAAGFTYTFRMTSHVVDANGKVKDDTPMVARVQVTGDRARLDVDESKTQQGGDGMVKKGGWMISDRARKTLTMVDPEEKTYSTMPADAFGQMMGGMMAGMGRMMKVQISDAKFSSQDLGSGGLVNGLPTHHYKATHDYVMDLQIMWKKEHSVVHTEAEYWVNDELKSYPNPVYDMAVSIGAGMIASDSTFGRQVREATSKLFLGVPVKSVSHTTTTNQKGEMTESVNTMEVVDFRRGDVSPSIFAVPAGYTEKTVTEEDMAAARAQQDSARKADQSADREQATKDSVVADSASKASPKDAAKKKLRGMFRKP